MSKRVEKPKTKLFGRNIFTLMFIIVCGALLFGITYSITTYVTAGNDNKIIPFVTADSDGASVTFETDDVIRMEGKNFDKFEIEFSCYDYDTDKNKATFKIKTYKNENTKNIGSNTQQIALAVGADWVGFVSYSHESLSKTFYIADDEEACENSSKYTATLYVYDLIDFPAKANTWPIPVTVNTPDAYVFIKYTYFTNDNVTAGETKTEYYILHYSYSEFNVQTGGLTK